MPATTIKRTMVRRSHAFVQTPRVVDYHRLATLLTNLGISPERLEKAVEQAILEGDAQGLARLSASEKRLVYYALGEGLASLRRDQDAALRAMGLTMSTFRSEAHLYRDAFLGVSRRTNWLLATVAGLVLAGLLLQWTGKGEGNRGFDLPCTAVGPDRLSIGRGTSVAPSLALGFGELAARAPVSTHMARRLAIKSGLSRRILVREPGGLIQGRLATAGVERA